MEFQALNQYLLSKPEAAQDFPFGDDVYVYKVKKKMFALVGWREGKMMINLKCEPDEAAALCELFSAITPGYHMDKKHWISVYFDGSVPEGEIKRLIDASFILVVGRMTKKDQRSIMLHL